MKKIVRRRERGRKKYLRLLSAMLCFCLLITACPYMPGAVVVHAEVKKWNCGSPGSNVMVDSRTTFATSAVTAELDANGTLTVSLVSGDGVMAEFSEWGAPWYEDRKNIKRIVIESGVTRIGRRAFQYSNVTEVIMSDSVAEIGWAAFQGSEKLTEVNIPAKVTLMEFDAFENCTGLAKVTFEGTDTIPWVRESAFDGCKFVTENIRGIEIPACKYLPDYKSTQAAKGLGEYKDYVGTEHSLDHVGGVAATCVKQGTIEHYKCSVCGATYKDSEGETITYSVIDYRKSHNYHYTASGNTITQTCDRGCDLSATARLSLKSGANRTYTGNPVTPVEVICSDNWAGDKPTVTYKNNTDAGTATASMTVSDTSTDPASDVTASLDFQITPATITGVSASGYTGTYDGAAHGITVTAPTGATVKYRKDPSESYTLSSPTYTDAGTYTVYYQVTKPNHTTQTGSEKVTINKCSISSATVTLQSGTLTYNGTEQTKEVSSVKVNRRTLAAGDYTVSGNKQTNAGEYTITISGTGNYTGIKTVKFTIASATLTGVTASGYTGTYDGSSHGIKVTAPTGAAIKYRDTAGNYTLSESPVYADFGTYTVYYQVTQPNYNAKTGSATVQISRCSIDNSNVAITLKSGTLTYNGAEQTKEVSSVKVNKRTLDKAADYEVSGNTGTDAKAYTITITGKGNYTGKATTTFTIARKSLTDDMITIASGPHYYTGSAIEPAVTVEDGKKLTGAEYTVSYAENVNVGTANVTVSGTGNYTGSIQKTFEIAARSISSATVGLKGGTLTYNGEPQTQEVGSVTVNGRTLAKGTDYEVTGNTGTDAGTYHTLTITGKGNYTGTKTVDFEIAPKPLADSMVTVASGPHYYTGSGVTPAVTLKDGDKALEGSTDYTVSYENNINQGTAKVTVDGAGNYTGRISRVFTIEYRPLPDNMSLEDYVTISPDSKDGWRGDDISLTPKDGFEVGDTPAGMGSSAVTVSQESGTDGSTKTIYVKDSDGNIYQTEFSYKLDKTPPAADLTGMTVKNGTKDLWNWIIGKKSMMIKIPVSGITDVLSGVAEVSYTATSENGGTARSEILQAQGGYYEIALNAEFSGTIQLTAEDKAGNTTQVSLTADSGKVIAEDYAPVVTFTMPDTPKPSAGGWYNTAVTVTVAVTDDKDSNSGTIFSGGIAGIRWKEGEDGAEHTVTGLPGTAPVYQETFTIGVNSDGAHTYYVNAVDNAGNESGWQTVTVKVDTGEPDFSGDITVTNRTKEGADVTFTPSEGGKVYWIVSDAGTEPDAQEVKEQSGQKGGVQDITGIAEGSFTITGLTPGEKHTVYVVLEDAAGNLSGVKKESFLTLQKAPEITPEQLTVDYTDETIKLPGNIGKVEVYTDPQHPETSKVTPDTDGFLPVTPGTTVYIRYPEKTEDGLTAPASDTTEIQIPGRPAVPAAKQVTVTDTTAAVIHPGIDEEYVLVKKGNTPDWSKANTAGQFTGLDPNQEYDLYVRKKATENSFVSEPAKTEICTFVTIKKPAIEGDGAGKDGNTAPEPDAPDAGGSTVTYTGTYGEEYIPVIKVGGEEIIPGDGTAGSEMTWEEGTEIGTWEYTYPIPDGAAEVEVTVEFRKRTLTGITAEPGSLEIYADDAANVGMEALNDYVKENSSTHAVYDNKTSGTVQAAYTTTDSFEPKGGVYSYVVSVGGKTANATLTVNTVSAADTAPDKCLRRQKAGGYTEEEVAAWLPTQVTVTYTGTGYTARTENRAATWDTGSIGTDFGAETGRKTITGTVNLPAWATGENDVSIEIEFVDKNVLEDDQVQLIIPSFRYGAQALPDPQGSITVEDTNPAYAYLYSTDSGATWVTADKLPKSGSGYIIPGEYRVKVAYTGDNYIGEKAASFTVAKEELAVLPGTLEAENKNYDGAMDASLKTGGQPELSGVAAGDDVTLGGSLNAVFSEEGPKKDVPVTVTGFRLEGRDALCYELKNTAVILYATINNADGTPPVTEEEKPDIQIDYRKETLTGFTPGEKYEITVNENTVTITAATDGNLKLEEEWLGTTVSIVKSGNGKDKLDSEALSLTVPGRNAQAPLPLAAGESKPGAADGKLAGLEADQNYQISTDDGATWTEISADKNGEITKLAPGSYIVRVSSTESGFAGRPSVKVTIAAGQETGPEAEHTFPEQWTVEKEATEKEPGRQYKICEKCGIKIYQTIDPTGTPVDPYAGKIEKEVDVLPGAPDTVLNNSKEELAQSVLTEEEIAEIDNGADAKIWLEVAPDADISEKDKAQVQKAAEESVGAGAEVTYFDASLFKQVGNGEKTIIHEPGKPISVTIVIPEEIRNKDVLMVRNYQIIRLHEGKTDIIEGTYNEESAEFTFETDKFSTYAIFYKDIPRQAEPGTPTPTPGVTAKPGTPTVEPGVTAEPGTPTPTPGGTAKPGTTTVEPGEPTKPGTPTPTPGGTAKPGTPTAEPGEPTKPGIPTPAPRGTAKPGTPTSAPDESGQTGNEIEKRKDLSILLATGKQKGSAGIKLTWLKWKDASGYEVYGSYCNGKKNYKKLKTVKAAAERTYTHKKLEKNRAYKYYIAAYKMVDGKKKYVAKSPIIHVAMKYEMRTNAKKITVNKAKAVLSLTDTRYKKTVKIKAKAEKENSKKKLLTHDAKLRYYTDDDKVAAVSRTGKITARGRGICSVYVIANNGVCKKITVTVKS